MGAVLVSSLTVLAYLAFYTAYSKQEKRLSHRLLINVLTMSHGSSFDTLLVELNKALSLAGLTVLCLAFLFPKGDLRSSLCSHALGMLLTHTAYSTFKYYGSKMIPPLADWKTWPWSDLKDKKNYMTGVKKISILAGSFAQQAQLYGVFFSSASSLAFAFAIAMGTLHFYSMEIDFKGILQVRPFAFLPFPLALLAIGSILVRG